MGVVLIAEGDPQVLALAESYLQEHGHQTLSASTPAQALALVNRTQEQLDVLFTDIGLTDDPHAGLDLAIQAVERRPGLKVLYTTGLPVTDGMKALFVEGAALLEKPYTVDQLLTTLVVHFGMRPKS